MEKRRGKEKSPCETKEREERSKESNEQNFVMDKKQFLAFIAMVINCAVEMQGKSERIKMVLEAARRFLNIGDITGEDLDNTLRGGFGSQTNVSED